MRNFIYDKIFIKKFEIADRIHVHRLGKRLCEINPKDISMSEAVALMTGAMKPEKVKENNR